MESNKITKAYFIYAQKGQKSNISTIETNDRIKKVQELSKELYENNLQILYLIEISKTEEEKQINLSLLNNQGELFISNINLFTYFIN
jgi:flagellar basal body rod protein FlgF